MSPHGSGRRGPGVRTLFPSILLIAALSGAAPASAQLVLGGGAKEVPSVRIASGDRFEDELSTFKERAKERSKERLPQIERQLQLLTEDASPDNRALHKRLIRERSLLLDTVGLTDQTWELAHLPVEVPTDPTLDDWMEEELRLAKLRREAKASGELESTRRAILRTEESSRPDWLLTKAEIDHQHAETLWIRARVREAEERVKRLRQGMRVTEKDLGDAEQQLKNEAEALRARFGAEAEPILKLTPSKTATTAELDLAWADRAAGSLRVDALRTLLGESRPVQPGLRENLKRMVARVQSQTLSWGKRAFTPGGKARAKVAHKLELLRSAGLSLQLCEQYLRIIAPPKMWWQLPSFKYRVGITVVVVAVALLLFFSGGRLARRLLQMADELTGLTPKGRLLKGLSTAVSLVWPLALLAIFAPYLLWNVWDSKIRPLQALKLFDQPLFFLDTTAVSVFSIVKLGFAFWAAVVLSRVLREFLTERVYPKLDWDSGLTNALNTLVHYVVLLVGGVTGLRFVGVGMSSWAIFAGILGIGIGFGLRNVTENFIAGVILLIERPIKIGDWVQLDGVDGQVHQIRARSTMVLTRDHVTVIIPNSQLVSAQVTNWSYGDPKVRLSVAVGVAYGSDTGLCRKTLLEVVKKHGQVLKRPGPEVLFVDFGASTLDFKVTFWVDDQQNRFRIASDLRFAIDTAFRAKDIEIAFTQLDVHLRTPDGVQVRAAPAAPPPEAPPASPGESS